MIRFVVIAGAMLAGAALAQAADATCDSKDVLGVSRTVEIDTAGGPLFGDQYPPQAVLQPGEVVLTFDDGPHPTVTKDILETLAAQCTKATFFNVGQMAKNFPEVVRAVHAQGHTIGTHTWSHANLANRSLERAKDQIESAIRQEDQVLPNMVAPFFRFPYLADSKHVIAYLQSRNIATFGIDVDSVDYRARTPERVVRNVMNGLAKTHGGIILFHDIHDNTAKALPTVLAELKANNYKVVNFIPKTSVTPSVQPPAADPQQIVRKPRYKRSRPARRRAV